MTPQVNERNARPKRTKVSSARNDGFSPDQVENLARALDPSAIHVREIGGRKLSYIEGWFAIAQANGIFGPAAWDREMVHFERVYERSGTNSFCCGYLARVRIRVRAGATQIIREGTGWGAASAETLSEAHERAIKSAETDATKRALATFGNQFGLSLYDRTAGCGQSAFALINVDGTTLASSLSPEGFCSGLRQLVEACKTEDELRVLSEKNAPGILALRTRAPSLKNKMGEHYADILLRLIDRARGRLHVSEDPIGYPLESGTLAEERCSRPPAPADSDAYPGMREEDVPAASETSGSEAHHVALSENDQVGRTSESDNKESTEHKTKADQEYDDCQERLAPSRIAEGPRIDKSRLPFGATEKRLRDKRHLKQIAAMPCLVCNRQPSHPHHLRFAQKRGLAQKVSDEFVVPLCALHHGDLHRSLSEIGWWKAQKIDPLPISSALWAKRRVQGQTAHA